MTKTTSVLPEKHKGLVRPVCRWSPENVANKEDQSCEKEVCMYTERESTFEIFPSLKTGKRK